MLAMLFHWLAQIMVTTTMLVITTLATLLRLILLEAIRIYRTRPDSPLLWWGLAGFALTVASSLLLATLWPAAVGAVVWFLTIEAVDIFAAPVSQGATGRRGLAGWLR
ncbi:MAG: hypothetical protein Q7O66_21395 [Dehalococcoidia bacterium]|nr:hypothetical protein [Dehalococcoidia bacterium]